MEVDEKPDPEKAEVQTSDEVDLENDIPTSTITKDKSGEARKFKLIGFDSLNMDSKPIRVSVEKTAPATTLVKGK